MLTDSDGIQKRDDSGRIPIFVGGTGRSGTILLWEIFRRHPKVFTSLFVEWRLLTDDGGLLDLVRAVSEEWRPYSVDGSIRAFEAFVRDIAPLSSIARRWHSLVRATRLPISPPRYSTFEVGTDLAGGDARRFRAAASELLQALGVIEYPAWWCGTPSYTWRPRIRITPRHSRRTAAAIVSRFIETLLDGNKRSPDRTHWMDTTPGTMWRADELLDIFSRARFIHVRRNPLDTTASMLHQNWGGKSAEACAVWIRGCLERWDEVKRRCDPERVLELRLRDYAADPDGCTRKVCEFTGLDVVPEVLGCVDSTKHHIDRYKTDLSEEDIQNVKRILGPYGYDIEDSP